MIQVFTRRGRKIAYDDFATEVARELFEAGRFAAQTADPIEGPVKYGLLQQHQELSADRIESATRRSGIAGLPPMAVLTLYEAGMHEYASSQERQRR